MNTIWSSMNNTYAPREFGRMIGKSVGTLQRWDKKGILKAKRTPTKRRYYTHDQYLKYIGIKADENKKIIVYYRVSSASQKDDMERQKQALESFCTVNGYSVDEWYNDIGSGMNFKRKNFTKILQMMEMGEIKQLIIAHKDRLVRFGFEWFESFAKKHGTKIIIMNNESLSPQEEMVKDLLSIIHCFSSRLYGLRKYKNKIKEAIKLEANSNPSK